MQLKDKYLKEIVPSLVKKFGFSSIMQSPKLLKICINRGEGRATSDKKQIKSAVDDLTVISGQKATITYAKVSVSSFKLREGMPIGAMVTLRGIIMYEFFDRLVNFALPREKDFRGVSSKSFDNFGNYNLGIKEQIIFPEINFDSVQKLAGMNISFVTSSNSRDESLTLLKELGMPFR